MMAMKRAALGTAMALALITPAAAGDGWYLGLGAGWNAPQGVHVGGPGAADGTFHFKDNFRGTASAGFKMPDGLRFEFQAGYTDLRLRSFTPVGGGTVPVHGTAPAWTFGGGAMY